MDEFSFQNKWFKELFLGLLLGFGFISLLTFALYLLGNYSIISFQLSSKSILMLFFIIFFALNEELLYRGIIFRITEEKLGSIIALIISSLIFGLIHLHNPNASWLSTLSISFEAGILLGALYMYTRRLWLPVSMHIAWNFTMGIIYGLPVSGFNFPSFFVAKTQGSELITGGAFGPEASIITLIFGTLFGLFILYLSYKRGYFVQPFWKNNKDNLNKECNLLSLPTNIIESLELKTKSNIIY